MRLNVIVKGSRKSQRALKRAIKRMKNPTQANKRVSIWLLRWVNENFKTEGGNVGGWKPFKYGGRKLPDGSIDTSARLLQDTGRLRASYSNFFSRTTAGVGSDIKYSLIHQLGLPRANLPARRMIPEPSDRDVERAVVQIYNSYIYKAMI